MYNNNEQCVLNIFILNGTIQYLITCTLCNNNHGKLLSPKSRRLFLSNVKT